MDFGAFDHPRPDLTSDRACQLARDVYGLDGKAQSLPGERDHSFLVETAKAVYVLKVGNQGDGPDALVAQANAIVWAKTQDPSLPLAKVVATTGGALVGTRDGFQLQLTEYVDGDPSRHTRPTPGFRRSVSKLGARLDAALEGFDHPVLHRKFPWSLPQLVDLRPLVDKATAHRHLIESGISQFEQCVLPVLKRLPAQAIHGDLNSDNIVVDPKDPDRVAGVFDFGDMGWAPAVVDLAIAATYQCADANPMHVMVQMATAYHLERPLILEEVSLIPGLVAARCTQSLLMSARQLRANPENASYFGSDVDQMAETLLWLTDTNRKRAIEAMVVACGLGADATAKSTVVASRHAHMAPSYRLTYTDAVHPVSAKGVWIIDQQGRRLLDAYNNVPHVGHGHPQVLAALTSQSRRLNTNTRYLVDNVANYASRLAASLPDPLSTVFFTNSGSEANDLAYRIATTNTGGTGAITTANAYHGATTVTAALSPEEYETSEMADWAFTFEFGHFDGAVLDQKLGSLGIEPAMVMVDTIFSSEGIHPARPEMLDGLRSWAHERGALLVADEVQAGFGRVGLQFWGFGDVTPDIVTLGKPMGNGYPMGAVVTTSEIAERFAAASSYFSTFAGSPVAAAVGLAVLDVIETEGLASHAEDVGGSIRTGINDLNHPAITEIRGAGLFIGVELVSAEMSDTVVEEMRRHGVLIGRTGPAANVLKIRPPLVFGRQHADLLIEELSAALG